VAGSSGSKNVILIIDVSGSMSSNNRIATAIAAAKAAVNTFSNNDFIGVIKFSSSASSLVNGQIKRATTSYKNRLIAAID
jgi:Mg-chelatase subunit ChlD